MIHATFSVFLIQMDDRFRIGVRREDVSAPLQFPAQFAEVVDFAVEHNPDGSVFVSNRLAPGSQVDDAQAAHAQTPSRAEVVTFVVGTPVGDSGAHIAQLSLENGLTFQANDAGNPAHISL